MRSIDRGPKPDGIDQLASQHTQSWVDYFGTSPAQRGERPQDSGWTRFRGILGERSEYLCWYCECRCRKNEADRDAWTPTVDHFRPKSEFPELAYDWSNWVFSCLACNTYKADKWSHGPEYIDPAASAGTEGPEKYFDFKVVKDRGLVRIFPRSGTGNDAKARVQRTIDDFCLDRFVLNKNRLSAYNCFMVLWNELEAEMSDSERKKLSSCLLELPVTDWQFFVAHLPKLPLNIRQELIEAFINRMSDVDARRLFLKRFGSSVREWLRKPNSISHVEYIGFIGTTLAQYLRLRDSGADPTLPTSDS